MDAEWLNLTKGDFMEKIVFRCDCGAWCERELEDLESHYGRWCPKCRPQEISEEDGNYVNI